MSYLFSKNPRPGRGWSGLLWTEPCINFSLTVTWALLASYILNWGTWWPPVSPAAGCNWGTWSPPVSPAAGCNVFTPPWCAVPTTSGPWRFCGRWCVTANWWWYVTANWCCNCVLSSINLGGTVILPKYLYLLLGRLLPGTAGYNQCSTVHTSQCVFRPSSIAYSSAPACPEHSQTKVMNSLGT